MSNWIRDVEKTHLSPWVTLLEKRVITDEGGEQVFHGLEIADYANVLAVTEERNVILVRQYRPMVGTYTLELPGGLVEGKESPSDRAAIEFDEETGLNVSASKLRLLGVLAPCPARLENRIHGFYVSEVKSERRSTFVPEAGVETIEMSLPELRSAVIEGKILNAQHVALIGIAALRGWLD